MKLCKIINPKKIKFSDLLVVICLLISILCIDILFMNLYNSYFKSKHILNSTNEHRLVDLEKSTSSFIRDYNKVVSLKEFHKEFSDNKNYIYYEATIQPSNILNFKGKDIFLYNYEENLHTVLENSADVKTTFQIVKQILVNYNFSDKINLSTNIARGQSFTQEDFYTDNYDEIPIILGYDYNDVYQVGDIIDIMPQEGVYATYKVIGFLKQDSSAFIKNQLIFLDRYILAPSLNITKAPTDLNELMYQGFLYLQKSNGIVKLSQGYELQDFLINLENLRIKYNTFDIAILNYSMIETNSLKMLVYEDVTILLVLFVVMFIFSVISLSSYIIIIINSSLYTYRVYLLSGYSIKEIQRSVYLKLLSLIAIPMSISMIFMYLFFDSSILMLFTFKLLLLSIYCISTLIIIKFNFKNITIGQLMKGDNND